tara:strand:+ start:1411 stop:2067 length:657 start_codon:yes stop_codon:yes gene_type:complete
MRYIILLLLFPVCSAWSLPKCENFPYKKDDFEKIIYWNNCDETITLSNGIEYNEKFKNEKCPNCKIYTAQKQQEDNREYLDYLTKKPLFNNLKIFEEIYIYLIIIFILPAIAIFHLGLSLMIPKARKELMEAIKKEFSSFFQFTGRISREHYFYIISIYILIYIGSVYIVTVMGKSLLGTYIATVSNLYLILFISLLGSFLLISLIGLKELPVNINGF